jgi:spermidine/putrescine transport system ATP-binding protein
MVESDVSIRKLVKRFGDMIAVDGIDLEVPRGAFVTFLGPSGCGKTTTLRMIGGFEHPDSGEIYLKGEPMGDRPPHKRDTSMVFQNYALFPHMSVADNIGFGLRERKMPKDRVRSRVQEMLELIELPDRGKRKPSQLSGGQQQRVALARSLVVEPTVLLLDEPLGALDLKLRKQMQIELKRIQRQVGITFIYVTHDQEEAITMSDRIVVMNRGRVEQEGSAEEIFERPRTRFVAEFMGTQNILDASITDRDATSTRVSLGGAGLTLPRAFPADVRSGALVIRPEKIRLDVPDGLSGVVKERIYKGVMMSYLVALDGGVEVIAEVAHDDVAHRHEVGDRVRVGFRMEDVVFIPDGTEGA